MSLLKNKMIDKKENIIDLCKRNFGIGSDGVILALPPKGKGDMSMKIFNSDGNEAEMCGNGVRCLISFINNNSSKRINKKYIVETLSGNIIVQIDSTFFCYFHSFFKYIQ